MFYHEQQSSWLQDTFDLVQATHWVANRAEYERCHHTIKSLISERESFRRGLCQFDRNTRRRQTFPCITQHSSIWLNGFDTLNSFGLIEREVQSRSRSYFQHMTTGLFNNLFPQRLHKASF